MAQAKTLDHRIGVGERAEQQHEQRIDHQEREDCQQRGNPCQSHGAVPRAIDTVAREIATRGPA